MKKWLKNGLFGSFIGFVIGLLPIIPIDVSDNPLEIFLSLPIIPIALIFGAGGHPPLAMFIAPFFYPIIGFIAGVFISILKK